MSRNFSIELLRELSKYSEKTALIWRNFPITYSEFSIFVKKWELMLKKIKAAKSTDPLRIALFCSNSPDIIAITLAAQLIGITLIPLNPSYKKYEITEYLKLSNANFCILSDDVDLEKFDDVENVHTIAELLLEDGSRDAEGRESHSGQPTSGSIIFFSSGTTGPPKPFEYSQRQLCAQIDQIKAIQEAPGHRFYTPTTSDVCYGVLPFFHAGGLITVLSMLFSGCSVLINERFDEREFLENCEKFQASVLFLVPPVLKFLAKHPMVLKFEWKMLKTIFVGAAASSPDDFKRVKERMKGLENLIQLYGSTECGVLVCSTGRGISDGTTVGLPYPLVEIKLDSSTNEILVKSPTAIDDGFMQTGDLGCLAYKSNELIIKGRSKEMMKVRGWQVNPNEIEDVVRKVEQVADCAVFQNSEGELIAKVIMKPSSESKEDVQKEIMSVVKDNLASYKRLNKVIFVAELPRNPSGKLVRHLLQ